MNNPYAQSNQGVMNAARSYTGHIGLPTDLTVLRTSFISDDHQDWVELGGGVIHVETSTSFPNTFVTEYLVGNSYGALSRFYPSFHRFSFDKSTGTLTVSEVDRAKKQFTIKFILKRA